MSVVRGEEDAVAQERRAPVGALGGVAGDTARRISRTRVTPDLPAAAGVERADFVRRRYKEDALAHQWRGFEALIRIRPGPLQLQFAGVLRRDLIERAVPVAVRFAVVSRPLGRGGMQDSRDGRGGHRFRFRLQRADRDAAETSQISKKVAALALRSAQRRHGGGFFAGDLNVFGIGERMHPAVGRL